MPGTKTAIDFPFFFDEHPNNKNNDDNNKIIFFIVCILVLYKTIVKSKNCFYNKNMKNEVQNSISKISHIHSLTQDFLIKKLNEQGLNKVASSHGNILFQLSLVPKMKMNELAQKINRDKSTTTVLVRKLEAEGLVFMKTDEADRRNKFIMLTEKGSDYNSRTLDISKKLIEKFYTGFSEDEKNQFVFLLNRIERNFSI